MKFEIIAERRLNGFVVQPMHRSTCSQSSSEEDRAEGPEEPEGSTSGKATKPQSIWTEADETALIDFLSLHRAEAGDGGNFKEAVFNAAAIEMKNIMMMGPEKTSSACRSKWDRVCHWCLPFHLV